MSCVASSRYYNTEVLDIPTYRVLDYNNVPRIFELLEDIKCGVKCKMNNVLKYNNNKP